MLITCTSWQSVCVCVSDPSHSSVVCITLPQICYTVSGASDVTCGWLHCGLHHLRILIAPLKRWNQTVSTTLRGKQALASLLQQSSALARLQKRFIALYKPCCSAIKAFSPSHSSVMRSLTTFRLTVVTLKYYPLPDPTVQSHLNPQLMWERRQRGVWEPEFQRVQDNNNKKAFNKCSFRVTARTDCPNHEAACYKMKKRWTTKCKDCH